MKDILVGLSIFADTLDFRNPQTVALVLTGHFDDILLKTFFWTGHHREPVGEEYKTDARTVSNLAYAKERIRSDLQFIFRMAEQEEVMAQKQKFEKIRQELRQSNKPHEMGTVDEIAAKFKISKSEVRRRKAAGTLHELLVNQPT